MSATIVARGSGERHTGQAIEIAELTQSGDAVLVTEGTSLQLPGLQNTVLRNVLESWETTLAPSMPMLMLSLNAAASQASEFRLRVERLPGRKLAWVGPVVNPVSEDVSDADSLSTDGADQTAVDAVDKLVRILGLPIRDVLAAAGVARRTFYSWRGRNVAPRLDSQGRLWELLQAAVDLQDVIGNDLPQWIAADPKRRRTLRAGNFDSLMGELLEQRARKGDYSARSHAVSWMESAGPEEAAVLEPPSRRLAGRVTKAKPGTRSRSGEHPNN